MGALLGMMLGAGMKYAGAKHQQNQQMQAQTAEMMAMMGLKNPQMFQNPEFRKGVEKIYGKDMTEMMVNAGQMAQQSAQQASQVMNGSVGSPATTGGGGGNPAASASSGPQQPQTPDEIYAHIAQIQQFTDKNPQYRDLGEKHIAVLEKQASHLQSEANYQQTQKRITDNEAREQQNWKGDYDLRVREINASEANASATRALAKSNSDFQHDMATEKDQEARTRLVQSQYNVIQTHLQRIRDDYSSMKQGDKPANPAEMQAAVDAQNASVDQLIKLARRNGVDITSLGIDPESLRAHVDPKTNSVNFGIPLIGSSGAPADIGGGSASGGSAVDSVLKAAGITK